MKRPGNNPPAFIAAHEPVFLRWSGFLLLGGLQHGEKYQMGAGQKSASNKWGRHGAELTSPREKFSLIFSLWSIFSL